MNVKQRCLCRFWRELMLKVWRFESGEWRFSRAAVGVFRFVVRFSRVVAVQLTDHFPAGDVLRM